MLAIGHFIIRDSRPWLLSRRGVSSPRPSFLIDARASDTGEAAIQASARPAQLDVSAGQSARTARHAVQGTRL